MTATENEEIARRTVEEIWNEKRLDVIEELYHPDYVGHWFALDGGDADRAALEAFIAGIHEGFPDYEMDIEFVHANDDMVTVGFTGSGTHEAEWMGIPPRSDPVEPSRPIPGHVTSRIEDGQIVEGWATWDALGLLQELGVLPAELAGMAPPADD